VSRTTREELESLRADGISAARRAEFRVAEEATRAWDRAHPADLEAILAWIDELRALFGDPPVDRTPWRGEDFRL
jgi:hypothetical protein